MPDRVEPRFADHLEKRGSFEVRLSLSSGSFYPPERRGEAVAWLAEKDEETARQEGARRTQVALTAIAAEKRQRMASAIIIGIALLTLIVGVLSWVFPRH